MTHSCRLPWIAITVLILVCPVLAQNRDAHFQLVDDARTLIGQRNFQQAIELLRPVYTESLSAAWELAHAYRLSERRLGFVEIARAEAEKGNPFVSYALAMLMRNGYVLEPRSIERYLLNAVRGGIGSAAHELGNIYFYGLEAGSLTKSEPRVSVDVEKARDMFHSCASDPTVGRECSIGLAHSLLELHPRAPDEAIALLEKMNAYDALWGIHYFGIGVLADKNKASS